MWQPCYQTLVWYPWLGFARLNSILSNNLTGWLLSAWYLLNDHTCLNKLATCSFQVQVCISMCDHHTAQKLKFFIKDFVQIRSHLLKKSLTGNFIILCSVIYQRVKHSNVYKYIKPVSHGKSREMVYLVIPKYRGWQ